MLARQRHSLQAGVLDPFSPAATHFVDLLHGMVENPASQELIQQGTAAAGAGALKLPTLRCRSLMHILLLLQFLCMP